MKQEITARSCRSRNDNLCKCYDSDAYTVFFSPVKTERIIDVFCFCVPSLPVDYIPPPSPTLLLAE